MEQFDIVLFGATSFVGKILCKYLLEISQSADAQANQVSWAIAGRSMKKLDELKAALGPAAADLPILVADATQPASLARLCEKTKLVISTVGPYALFGEPMVKACVASGTDYCDLTGEPQFIASMLKRYEDVAKISGARIVHSCGFDSVPSDLGVWYLQQKALEAYSAPCSSVNMRVHTMKGSASGGTVASMLNLVKEARSNPSIRKVMLNPYSLCPPVHGFSVRQNETRGVVFDPEIQRWTAPFIMAAINTKIVHRSNALLDDAYTQHFRYDEAMVTGTGAIGNVKANGLTLGLGGFMFAAAIGPCRWLLEHTILPKPGQGPSEKAQLEGHYDLRFYGHTDKGKKLAVKVTGDRDPGYGSTAKILAQSAICLVKDLGKDTADSEKTQGGFWTPASIMAEPLISRLEAYGGLTFSLLD